MASLKDFLLDNFLQFGVSGTFILGILNLYFTFKMGKRTTFINTVTSERVKWIGKVRQNISTLCAVCDQWLTNRNPVSDPEHQYKMQQSRAELQHKMEQLKIEVRLQLNPQDPEDQEIERLIGRLPSLAKSMTPEEYEDIQAALVVATQAMLKREWDKVKDESVKGDLRPTFRHRS